MWTGLSSRHTTRAAGAALVRVLVLPWLVFGLLMTLVMLTSIGSKGAMGGISEDQQVLVVWLVLALLNDLFFGLSARQKLLRQFRSLAMQRFDIKRPSLRSLTTRSG